MLPQREISMPAQNNPNEVGHVLIVDDHQPTARLISTAFDEVSSGVSTHVVGDGSECLSVLRGETDSTPAPDIVLLDLGLPDVDGLTVLETRSEDQSLRQIPTIVLSGRDDAETIGKCYERGANTFISKPDEFDGYLTVANAITDYWFSTAKLP